ncbi:MAG: HNH endonuclease [Anaerolineales bacterium]|nr:HNH endonuclease [Anaerolineales bacterium]
MNASGKSYYEKDKKLIDLYLAGESVRSIAKSVKLSPERVSQRLERNGFSGRNYRWVPKKNKLLSALRKEKSFQVVAQNLQLSEQKLNSAIRYYSLEEKLSEAKRRWRKKKSNDYYLSRQGELINKIRKLASELGHTPRQEDLQDAKIPHMTLVRTFGSLADAMVASGLMPNGHRYTAPLPKDFEDIESPTTDLGEAVRRANLIRATKKEILEPKGSQKPKQKTVTSKVYYRDPNVIAWVLSYAKGVCELCSNKGYKTDSVDNYLEVHHVIPLSSGGPDTISNAVAICETCHGKLHRAKDRDRLKKKLYKRTGRLRK